MIYSVISGKGGTGKTTFCANIGKTLADKGKKVLLVDMDIGLRSLDIVLGLADKVVYDIFDVCEGRVELADAIIKHPKHESLFLLPAPQTISKSDIAASQIRALCREIHDEFDFVFIDSPPGIERGFECAVAGADRHILVLTADAVCIRGADRVLGALEALGEDCARTVINRYRPFWAKKSIMSSAEDILNTLSTDLLGIVPESREILLTSALNGRSISPPRSEASAAFANIAERLLGNSVPLMKMKESFLSEIFK
ncbi:MAG: septum site-determining protein MinD [Clostridia bacterium]|nr:septum site-determining protein MinD [Clostridia bacterium]